VGLHQFHPSTNSPIPFSFPLLSLSRRVFLKTGRRNSLSLHDNLHHPLSSLPTPVAPILVPSGGRGREKNALPYTQGHGGTLREFAYWLPKNLGSLPCPVFKGYGVEGTKIDIISPYSYLTTPPRREE
jgi:hypothetical protein